MNVAIFNIADTGADVVIGTRSGNATASSTGAWHKIDLAETSAWNGNLSYGTLADGVWHHIAYVGDTSGRTLYKDGVEIASNSSVVVNTNSGRPFEFGGTSQFNEDVTGLYSDVAVWNERITVAQIQALAAGGPVIPVPEPSAVALFGPAGLGLILRRRRE